MTIIDGDLSLHLPNIRSLFLPTDGHVLVEGDLARADACVAAWDADATDLKEQIHAGQDFHSDNAQMLYGSVWDGARFQRTRDINPRAMHVNGMSFRDNAKRWVHATNFHGGPRTVSQAIACNEDHTRRCQEWWCNERHPQIARWHTRVGHELNSRRMPVIFNRFGFRRVYVGGSPYGRSNTGNLLSQALAWICQSTVAIAINRGIARVDCRRELLGRDRCGTCLCCRGHQWRLLLQVHDSALSEIAASALDAQAIRDYAAALTVLVPYDDPLYIPVEVKYSTTDWGSMRKWTDGTTPL